MRFPVEIRSGRGAGMMLFVVCQACGQATEESGVLMLAKHFPWTCPTCGALNAPANSSMNETVLEMDDDEEVTVTHAELENATVVRKLL